MATNNDPTASTMVSFYQIIPQPAVAITLNDFEGQEWKNHQPCRPLRLWIFEKLCV